MNHHEYRVSTSGFVLDQFRAIVEIARSQDQLKLVRDSGDWIMKELKSAPSSFGESREDFPEAGLQMRIGFSGPITVLFGVLEKSKNVFIRSFKWMPRG